MTEYSNQLKLIEEAVQGKYGDDTQHVATAGLKMVSTLVRKNVDYNSSVYKQPIYAPDVTVEQAIRVRLSDKHSRMTQLLKSGKAMVGDESVQDTAMDFANYLLLWLSAPQPQNAQQGNADATPPTATTTTTTATTKEEELLVVVPAASLPAAIRNAPNANTSLLEIDSSPSLASWTASLINEFGFIMPRTFAETDKRQRQLITYTVLVTTNTSGTYSVLVYNRNKSGGEARLNDKLSVGIGGHVNKEDWDEAKATGRSLLTVATLRELEEELAIDASKVDPDTFFEGVLAGEWDEAYAYGLICSSASDVDSVHLGLVRIIEVPSRFAPHISMQDNPSQWVDIAKLGDHFLKLESWSKICADTLGDLYV